MLSLSPYCICCGSFYFLSNVPVSLYSSRISPISSLDAIYFLLVSCYSHIQHSLLLYVYCPVHLLLLCLRISSSNTKETLKSTERRHISSLGRKFLWVILLCHLLVNMFLLTCTHNYAAYEIRTEE